MIKCRSTLLLARSWRGENMIYFYELCVFFKRYKTIVDLKKSGNEKKYAIKKQNI